MSLAEGISTSQLHCQIPTSARWGQGRTHVNPFDISLSSNRHDDAGGGNNAAASQMLVVFFLSSVGHTRNKVVNKVGWGRKGMTMKMTCEENEDEKRNKTRKKNRRLRNVERAVSVTENQSLRGKGKRFCTESQGKEESREKTNPRERDSQRKSWSRVLIKA